MVLYTVYEASFLTQRGSRRFSLGCTANPLAREFELQAKGPRLPAYLKAGTEQFKFRLLVEGLPSKQAALATEALLTARRYQSSFQTRGGPWCRPTLSQRDEAELRAVSECRTLEELFTLAAGYSSGSLHDHMKDLKYRPPAQSHASASASCEPLSRRVLAFRSPEPLKATLTPAVLAAVKPLRASGRSTRGGRGTVNGHTARTRKGLKYGDDGFAQAKWGKRPDEAKKDAWKKFSQKRRAKGVKKKPAVLV